MSLYLATLLALTWLAITSIYWNGLISAIVATTGSVLLIERGSWPLGLFVRPQLALRELALGCLWGAALISAGALFLDVTTGISHSAGRGFPWSEIALVFVPAVFHEELLFRGYPFQKLHRRSRVVALFLFAGTFALLHAGNAAVTPLGQVNIFLGGILLGLAWERYRRLWFPIGLHLAWNLMMGPVLGDEVSGYEPMRTLLVERGGGPSWLTGGEFGIEGSAVITVLELLAAGLLGKWRREPGAGRPGELAGNHDCR